MFTQPKMYASLTATQELKWQLKSVLLDYERSYDANPHRLRADISAEEVWRFFVDGVRQGKGWRKFEKTEPGYFKAMYQAFQEIFIHTDIINVDFIKYLHKIALHDVKHTNYEDDYIYGPGEFRGEDHARGGTYICAVNTTLEGLYEALNEPSHSLLNISIEYMDFNYRRCVIDINKETITKLRQHRTELSDPDNINLEALNNIVREFCDNEYLDYLQGDRIIAARLFSRLSQTITCRDLAVCLYDLIQSREYLDDNYSFLLRSNAVEGKVLATLNAEMVTFINTFHRSMPLDNDPLKKLSVIISFVQSCEQLHPFSDANCRVFCMLLLNHLLIRNGFPPAILDDPNRFDLYSQSELLQQVIRGMRNTLTLQAQSQLYRFNVLNYMTDLLESKNKAEIEFYEELMAIENKNREIMECKIMNSVTL